LKASDPWQILIVDDDEDSLRVIAEALLLYRGDTEVRSAGRGGECLEMLSGFTPTAVIVDLALPDIDGWEVLAAIRGDPATACIPVVATTAYGSANVAEDALRAGFDAYLPKPIDVFSFGERLAKVITP
jgi:CheY-like chemotaxis protein